MRKILTHHRRPARLVVAVVALLLVALPAAVGKTADEASGKILATIGHWLVLGPVAAPWPAFHDEGDDFGLAELLAVDLIELRDLWPAAGEALAGVGEEKLAWTDRAAGDQGLKLATPGEVPQIAYLAAYLTTDRFVEVDLKLRSHHLLRVFLDGKPLGEKKTGEKASEPPGRRRRSRQEVVPGQLEATLTLTTGKHLVLVQALADPDGHDAWTVAGELVATDAEVEPPAIGVGTDPRHELRIVDLLDAPRVGDLHVSPGGEYVAIELRTPGVPAEWTEQWIEIRRTADGAVVRVLRGGESGFAWTGEGSAFSYQTPGKEGTDLWLASLDGGEPRRILTKVENFGSYLWTRDRKSIIYAVEEPVEADERGVKRYRALPDRWTGWRNRTHLYQVSVADGVRRRLSVGRHSQGLLDVSPDGGRVLLSHTRANVTEAPFSEVELLELDLATLKARSLARLGWFTSASYSPDGRWLLILGGPREFDGVGTNVPEGMVPNEYDTQAFLYDLATGAVDPITREYDPSIQDAEWPRGDHRIWFRVRDRVWGRIVRYDPQERSFVPLATDLDVVRTMSTSEDGGTVVWLGSSANRPYRVLARTGDDQAPVEILIPGAERFAAVELGEVEPWSFVAGDGTEILGRVHYPPDFDPQRRYPLLVYYYGGTSPIERSFGGRYPKNLWAAQGYVVYVLQPSGATGFGQAFSARHVNNWGQTVAGEIIAGTQQFVAAHPFVDPERIGCLGASYGGFMTMLLVTRTDLFAAAVSHAGISSISSYWGQGWWGYHYSSTASAGSYPWNNREVYVEQSPLFHADRIRTPLLLLHGGGDTNVPPGESQQLYTALKVLGREVELIEVGGENHQILTYPKRVLWMETILAWFDKHLKRQPEYWEHLWGDEAKPKG